MSGPIGDREPHHVVYQTVRQNVIALLEPRPDSAALPVLACPGWTVRDVVGHLVDICHRVAARVTGQPERESASLARDLPDLLTEWAVVGARVEGILAGGGGNGILTMDAFSHELDIRAAIGVPPPADHPAYLGALDVVTGGFGSSVDSLGLPPVRIETAGASWTSGAGRPSGTLVGSRHDLFRSLAGRRTHAQIAGLSWSVPPEQWLPAFEWGPFHPPGRPCEEAGGES
jgi:uncharacterized protein (TIGR03083 family)